MASKPGLTVVAARPQTEIERQIEDYLADVRARGLSPRTIGHYDAVLHRVLLPWAVDEGVSDVAQLEPRTLNRLSTKLLEEGGARGPLSKHSVHSYLRAVNHFLSWAGRPFDHDRGGAGLDIRSKAKTPRLPEKVMEVLERSEIAAMQHAAATVRDALIIELLANTGIRVGELLGLTADDLILQGRQHFIRVHGKGAGGDGKDRLVSIEPALYRRLRSYAERGRPKDARTKRLFVGLRRRPGGDYAALTKSGVEQLVRVLGERAGIKKRVYPHLFRHSWATWALRNGMNPLLVQRTLGHADLTMITRVYSHLTVSDQYDAMLTLLRTEE